MQGQIPLHCACRNGHEELVRLLLGSGVDIFIGDQFGATPIDVARDWQRLHILDMLAEYQATAFRDSNFERVELAMNNISNQVDVPPGIFEVIADCLS